MVQLIRNCICSKMPVHVVGVKEDEIHACVGLASSKDTTPTKTY